MEQNNNVTEARAKITIAKYKRCSTDNQELQLQEDSLNKCISRLKEDNPNQTYEILDFEDKGVSGKTTEREGFKKMMDLVEKGKINLIIFTKLDRLARSLQDLLNITSKFQEKNVKFIVVEQSIDTSNANGRLLFQILGSFAEFERTIIRERMEAGRKKAEIIGTKSGKPCHRPHKEIDRDGVLFKYNQGMSMHSIAKFYNCSITPVRRIINEKNKS
jgi:DNA invertase Pin-like site-specific DNA recombinase